MSNVNKSIQEKLNRAGVLIQECLQELGVTNHDKIPVAVIGGNVPASLPEHILALRKEGFFKIPQTPKEVHAKLQGIYHCQPDRVGVALGRLLKKKELRKDLKEINGEKGVAYVW